MTTCRNCFLDGAGVFCSRCGQKLRIHLDPTLHDLVHDGVHEFLHIDGKIFKTLILLFRKPGMLTLEFLEGRRVSYINPIRLYLTMSILYFVLSAITFGADDGAKILGSSEVGDKKVEKVATQSTSDDSKLVIDTGSVWLDDTLRTGIPIIKKGSANINKNDKEFKRVYSSSIAKSLFLLMPLFGFIVMVSYGLRSKRYPQYLYFSLHYHAALFAGLLVTIPLGFVLDGIIFWWVIWAWIYLGFALKRVWMGTTKGAFVRASFTLSVYSIVFGIALAATGLYAVYKMGLEG